MPKRHDTRRLAMQILYQMVLRGENDLPAIREGLADGPDSAEVVEEAAVLAEAAWQQHDKADTLVRGLAPQWPTHRQPPVDRALLRLAYYEMTSGHAPVKVAINEAVELAKEYCSERARRSSTVCSTRWPNRSFPRKCNRSTPARPEDQWLTDAMDEPGDSTKPRMDGGRDPPVGCSIPHGPLQIHLRKGQGRPR